MFIQHLLVLHQATTLFSAYKNIVRELLQGPGYKQGSGNVEIRELAKIVPSVLAEMRRGLVRRHQGPGAFEDRLADARSQRGAGACRQGQKQVPRQQARCRLQSVTPRLPHDPPPPQQACLLPALYLAPASQTAGTELTKPPAETSAPN